MNIEIANRLIHLRKENGLSQEDLAVRLGISRQAISKWERAESSPDTDNLINLAKLYNVSLDRLLDIDDESLSELNYSNGPKPDSDAPTGYAVAEERDEPERRVGYPPVMRWLDSSFPVLITFLYLLLGFTFRLWHPAWMLFLLIPLYYTFSSAVRRG